VAERRDLLLLFYLLGSKFGHPPSAWLQLTSSPDDAAFALDFDATCLSVGLDAERYAYETAKYEAKVNAGRSRLTTETTRKFGG
jgi:hypothetical protein